jgi:hypothetical protein
VPASEKTALMAVMEADEERVKLEKLAEDLATREDEESQEYLMQVWNKELLIAGLTEVSQEYLMQVWNQGWY